MYQLSIERPTGATRRREQSASFLFGGDRIAASAWDDRGLSREWMSAQLFHPTSEQSPTIHFRRLVEVRWEKRVI
ncbi:MULTISPECIES: hypothetical protein [unclassified Mesorhizobium]|uniref:hypothetical protein n=1 Tax=unclassified Mesorhizobium TaxID=325217 RepID=UPI001093D871|nr:MULTISPECIES: hypothetical protein [unclassified Mesorhizobium]TGT35832.1 hypothetical protein EN808_31005 [Mesorhizobium sp. M8A.F.Ca.ET.165.01.1.1]TIS47477.1 MAG: hypothetical protein E5W96_23225 [Mesorhizobium sp.]TIU54603.1 MAG: hypothetical protein E5W35_21725 [Mesorhizobium sp.]